MLLNDINYYKRGAIELMKAKWSLITNGQVSEEVIEFRKSQCKKCPLFSNGICNRDFYSDGKSLIGKDRINDFEKIEKAGEIVQIKKDNIIYTSGCGCFLFSEETNGKVKYHFTDEVLERNDGFSPCPLNNWTKQKFEEYVIEKSNSRNVINDKP